MSAPPSQDAIRLQVTYQSPRALVGEFTRSVGRGTVVLESRRPLPLGARFAFELRAHGVSDLVQVLGEVVHCMPAPGPPGRFELGIQYAAGTDVRGLDAALRWISEAHRLERRRREHPRVPIVLLAADHASAAPRFLVRDLSLGGAGAELPADEPVPRALAVGAPSLLELPSSGRGSLLLHGEVVWLERPHGPARQLRPAFGMKFGRLRADAVARLEKVLALRGLPAPPWKARLSFGMDAVARMP